MKLFKSLLSRTKCRSNLRGWTFVPTSTVGKHLTRNVLFFFEGGMCVRISRNFDFFGALWHARCACSSTTSRTFSSLPQTTPSFGTLPNVSGINWKDINGSGIHSEIIIWGQRLDERENHLYVSNSTGEVEELVALPGLKTNCRAMKQWLPDESWLWISPECPLVPYVCNL